MWNMSNQSKTTETGEVHRLCYNVSGAKRAPSLPDITKRRSPALCSRRDDRDGLLRVDPLSRRRWVFNELELSTRTLPPRGSHCRTGPSSPPIRSWRRMGVLCRARFIPAVHFERNVSAFGGDARLGQTRRRLRWRGFACRSRARCHRAG